MRVIYEQNKKDKKQIRQQISEGSWSCGVLMLGCCGSIWGLKWFEDCVVVRVR